MQRFSEGYFAEASQVAEHNLVHSSELEYFLSKNYHEVVILYFSKLSTIQEYADVLLLIGTSARNIEIKTRYYREKIHFKILRLVEEHIGSNERFLANLLYSLSSLVYMQQEMCHDLIKYKK